MERVRWTPKRARAGGVVLAVWVLLAGVVLPSGAVGAARPAERAGRGSAWLPFWGDAEGAYRDALAHADQLHTVSPFWYETTGERAVTGRPGAVRPAVVAGLHRAGIAVVPTVTETLDAAAMGELLHDPVRRRAHVDALSGVVASQGTTGSTWTTRRWR
ncbi:hypothetical protein [Streptomyces noursei]|uniref:hypothetical protein n=1 Tax=Streptomyces noursei TaxID=1971 RepID=UPI0021A4FE05|nr:hypothetical protein [Streptomyces noursei]UWS75712.1 hypothetical protein N1H47_33465 [Streptomyces noursei]